MFSEDSLSFAPSALEPHQRGGVSDARDGAPFLQGAADSADREPAGISSVGDVLAGDYPAAVGGLIAPQRINSIDLVLGRTLAHVGKEVLEVEPAVADGDALRAPVGEVLVGLLEAPPLHGAPCSVGARVGFPVRSVGFSESAATVNSEAPTRLRRSVSKGLTLDDLLYSAGTPTQPRGLIVSVLPMKSQNGEASELLTREIDALAHVAQPTQPSGVCHGKVLRRFVLVKDAVVAIVFFASLLGAAAVMFQRLAEKPTMREMEEAVETRVAPVEKVQSEQAKTITTIESDVNRTKQVQEVVLEQNAYQGKVLEHIANKKRGDPPGKPKELERKETELMK